ncbi:MAG TPA: phenylalanine--tRNA ligase subunit beta [Bryobacterales bacterium]|nr:phenylalanine--tRNA ligase subunit beta [Bryobacterales bacterium]
MRILLSWLREYVDAPESPAELADALTMAGLAVDSVSEEQGETVFELDITPNRPDAMNHLGAAREVAAVFGRQARRPEIHLHEDRCPAAERASIEIADPDLCARYVGRVAVEVQAGPSPDWMRRRLELCGVRAINNVADITNYVLLEVGQPTHAFDLDTLEGHKIVVRRAAKGERLTTLDGVERALEPDHLVIADAARPVALAGIMGGAETEISERTRNVLIESAWFEPASIRRTARHFGMHTEASHRFERGADIEATVWAASRIAGLLEQLASAKILGGVIDAYPSVRRRAAIGLRTAALRRHLGIEIPAGEVERILQALGCTVERVGADWSVTPPSARLDVEREIDLIEEIARIYGYDRFPARLPAWTGHGDRSAAISEESRKEQRVRDVARALGYDEAITYSFLSAAEAERFGGGKAVAVRNPLSELQGVMRNSAVPGLLRAVEWNLHRGQGDVRLFEVGRLYGQEGKEFSEPPVLGLAATGSARPPAVNDRGKPYDFFEMKADVARLLELFEWKRIYFDRETEAAWYQPGRAARAVADGRTVGRFGELHSELAAERKLRQPVFVAEIWLDRLYKLPLREPQFRPLPRQPAVDRDFSLLVPEGTAFDRIVAAIGQRQYLARIEPVEIFRGGQVPPGKISLLLRAAWQRDDASLTDEEVNEYAREIVETLRRELGAEQRG